MIKKFTLLLLAMLCIAGTTKADTTWSNKDWSASPQVIDWNNVELLGKNNTAISIGDQITVTFAKTNSSNDANVDLRANYTRIVNQDFDSKSSLTSATFVISARERDAFCRYGLNLSGSNITVTAVTKTASGYTGGDNSIWVGSSNGWNSVAKNVFSDVKAGDRIVVNMSKTGEGNSFAFGYKDGGWADQPFTAGTDYKKTDSKAELYITDALATTIRNSNGIYVNGCGDYTYTSIDLMVEDQTKNVIYTPGTALTFKGNSNFEIPTEYLKGYKAGDKMYVNVTDISGTAAYSGEDATAYHRLSLAENNWEWIGWISENISSTGEIEFTITDQMITANKSLPLIIAGSNCVVDKITFKPTKVNVTIGADKCATYSCEQALNFSGTGVTAYYVSAVATGTVTLTEIDQVPANTGIMVYCETAGTYQIPVIETATLSETNYLKPNTEPSSIAASVEGTIHYIFAKDNTTDEIGFYKLVDAAHTLAAHKAYLETTTDFTPKTLSMGSRSYIRLSFGGGGGTTAINTALKNPIVEDGLYYTLQGVAVKNPSKGIYILNGKKVFVK